MNSHPQKIVFLNDKMIGVEDGDKDNDGGRNVDIAYFVKKSVKNPVSVVVNQIKNDKDTK